MPMPQERQAPRAPVPRQLQAHPQVAHHPPVPPRHLPQLGYARGREAEAGEVERLDGGGPGAGDGGQGREGEAGGGEVGGDDGFELRGEVVPGGHLGGAEGGSWLGCVLVVVCSSGSVERLLGFRVERGGRGNRLCIGGWLFLQRWHFNDYINPVRKVPMTLFLYAEIGKISL